MAFRALVVRENKDGKKTSNIETLTDDELPEGDVLVDVAYSTLNYKDGLCLGSGGGLVRKYPHVPGIDFSGKVIESSDSRYKAGDEVVLTGWRVGENRWGGYAGHARVPADYLVPLPENLTLEKSMAIGTAGLTAMLALITLEKHGLKPENGPVLVTGASGGVGSVATAICANAGYEVHAVSGSENIDEYLKGLGATAIVPRAEIDHRVKRPLEGERWAGAIDAVGGEMLARLLGQMKYSGSVAAIGLAGGADVPMTIVPFLLRGVSLLGIDSVMQPYEARVEAWARMCELFPFEKMGDMIEKHPLEDLPKLGKDILEGNIRGRIVIDVKA